MELNGFCLALLVLCYMIGWISNEVIDNYEIQSLFGGIQGHYLLGSMMKNRENFNLEIGFSFIVFDVHLSNSQNLMWQNHKEILEFLDEEDPRCVGGKILVTN